MIFMLVSVESPPPNPASSYCSPGLVQSSYCPPGLVVDNEGPAAVALEVCLVPVEVSDGDGEIEGEGLLDGIVGDGEEGWVVLLLLRFHHGVVDGLVLRVLLFLLSWLLLLVDVLLLLQLPGVVLLDCW